MAVTIRAHRNQVQAASGFNVLAGIWLFVSAFVVFAHGSMLTNNVLFGVLITVMALCRISGAYNESWLSWLNALLGLWVVISPWTIMGTGPAGPTQAMIINNCVTGGVVLVLACWSAVATDSTGAQTLETSVPPTNSGR